MKNHFHYQVEVEHYQVEVEHFLTVTYFQENYMDMSMNSPEIKLDL